MSKTRTVLRRIAKNEKQLHRVLMNKQPLNTKSPQMALAGNNPSRMKLARMRQHKLEQMTKLSRVVVACLITAAGGGHIAKPVAEAPKDATLKLDAYKKRLHERGTSLHAPGFVREPVKTRPVTPGNPPQGPKGRTFKRSARPQEVV
jgi:hypothetical protein